MIPILDDSLHRIAHSPGMTRGMCYSDIVPTEESIIFCPKHLQCDIQILISSISLWFDDPIRDLQLHLGGTWQNDGNESLGA